MKQVIVVGGGASGLMAAIWAARGTAQVTVLEQNDKPGKKLLASGNGRCNLTNLSQDLSCYRGNTQSLAWEKILRFPPEKSIAFFSSLGIHMRNQENWIYPHTMQASSVLQVLLMEAQAQKVKIKTRECVTSIERTPGRFLVHTKTWKYEADAVIIACGSPASSVQGSCDFALQFAKQTGHRTEAFLPALVALKSRDAFTSQWEGTRCSGNITVYAGDILLASETGNLQFIRHGLSGIPVFQVSRFAVHALAQGKQVTAHLDLFPEFSEDELHSLLMLRRKNCPYKGISELLVGLLPSQLIPIAVRLAKTALSSKEAAKGEDLIFCTLANLLKQWIVSISSSAPVQSAQVCSGGILLSELNDHLESRRIPNLYFAGEAVDVDGTCGGYNLQWAWTSGYLSGLHAGKEHGTISTQEESF